MREHVIPHDACIFVGDGRKALFLRNVGDEQYPNFRAEQVFVDDNPPTHARGSDRPGRGFASAERTRRSAIESTDWHEIEERRFAGRVAGALERLARERAVPALVIVAPPRALADIRDALHDDVKARVALEINKDLTKLPAWEIERRVLAELVPRSHTPATRK